MFYVFISIFASHKTQKYASGDISVQLMIMDSSVTLLWEKSDQAFSPFSPLCLDIPLTCLIILIQIGIYKSRSCKMILYYETVEKSTTRNYYQQEQNEPFTP